MSVTAERTVHRFLSKGIGTEKTQGVGLRLVREPLNRVPTASGIQITHNAATALTYQFVDGVLEVYEGQDVRADGPGGAEQDAVAFVRSHPHLGEYFHEEGQEPGRLRPSEVEVNAVIVAAVGDADAEPLEELRQQELATHRRDHVLAMIDAALAQIRQRDAATRPPVGAVGGSPPA